MADGLLLGDTILALVAHLVQVAERSRPLEPGEVDLHLLVLLLLHLVEG